MDRSIGRVTVALRDARSGLPYRFAPRITTCGGNAALSTISGNAPRPSPARQITSGTDLVGGDVLRAAASASSDHGRTGTAARRAAPPGRGRVRTESGNSGSAVALISAMVAQR